MKVATFKADKAGAKLANIFIRSLESKGELIDVQMVGNETIVTYTKDHKFRQVIENVYIVNNADYIMSGVTMSGCSHTDAITFCVFFEHTPVGWPAFTGSLAECKKFYIESKK